MRHALLSGWRATVRWWRLGVLLWAVSLAFGVGFASASAYWLARSLGDSLATRTLLTDLDANVFVDLLYHHGESLPMLFLVAVVLVLVYVGLSLWLHAALILVVQDREVGQLRTALLSGMAYVPLMARLFVIALGALAVFSFVVVDVTWRLVRATYAEPSEMITYYLLAAGIVSWILGYIALVAMHDHARLRACATGGGAWQSYWWAVRFVLAGGERAFRLAVVLHLMGAALWVTDHGVAINVPVTGGFAVAVLFVWGELFLLLRMWLRVWFFAAQNDLQSGTRRALPIGQR